jgi:hypothetical protein
VFAGLHGTILVKQVRDFTFEAYLRTRAMVGVVAWAANWVAASTTNWAADWPATDRLAVANSVAPWAAEVVRRVPAAPLFGGIARERLMLSTRAVRKDLATTVSRHRPGRASDLERRPPTRTTRAGGVSSVSSNGPESTLGGESTPIFFAVYPLKRFKRQLKRQGCTCPNTPNATKLPQTNQSYRKLGRYHCRVINAHNASSSTCTLILHGISQHLPNGASPTFLPRPDIATRNTSVSTTRVL